VRVLDKPATANPSFDRAAPDPASSWAPHRLFNIGNSDPTPLLSFIGCLEAALGVEAIKQFEPMQPGDVEATAANTTALESWVNFRPSTPIGEGVERFVAWYRQYYGV
jgi:UDP-glucuronate 4-epimerase